jgi:hypothetical protein
VDLERRTPSTARMYDVFLGGKDNFGVDRDAARQVERAAPSIVRAARDNRAFMQRTVTWGVRDAGIGQVVDIGTGIPTSPNVYEVAHRHNRDAVVVGVDHDPEVLAHDRARLGGLPILDGDIRNPGLVLADLERTGLIEWDQPVLLLLVAVLHFVSDEQDPAGIVATLAERLAPGSAVVISHVSSTGADPRAVAEIEAVYAKSTSPGSRFRTHEQIERLMQHWTAA